MREIDTRTKTAIRLHYRGVCQYCGATGAADVDHILSLASGGEDTIANLTLACSGCNSRKGAIDLDPMFLAIAHARAREAAPYIIERDTGLTAVDGVIMLASVGDLGNSSRIIAKAIQNIRSAGFHLVSEADGFDTRWPHGDAVLTAANLVLDMQQHWRADKKPKAGPVMTPERLYTAKILMQDDSLTVQEVADTIGVSKSALYRALKEERDQAAREQHDHLQRIGRLPKREKP